MTYSIFFYRILNEARESIPSAISLIVHGDYNWVQDFLILVFSPILYNERSSLIIINCIVLLISTILIFSTALRCKVPQFWAFCAALLFAAMPWNYEMRMQFSVTSLMPEPVYMGSYLCATILLCWLVSNPFSKRIAIAAGLALGVTICSRWNAIINLAMPIAGFGIVSVLRLLYLKDRPFLAIFKTYAIAALISLAFAAIYFGFEGRALYEYGYQVSVSSSFDLATKAAGAAWLLLNMPGLAVAGQWFYPNTLATPLYAVALTLLGHAIVLYAVISGVKRLSSALQSEIVIGALGLLGGTVFYLDIILATTSFGGFYSEVGFGELHFIEPALIGLVLCTLAIICGQLSRLELPRFRYFKVRVVYIVLAVLVAVNSNRVLKSSLVTNFAGVTWPSPDVDYGLNQVGYGRSCM